jgi:5-methylcytosine-specific restriction endonuclease McrA
MSELSWQTIVEKVHERALYCCEYCQTAQRAMGQAMHIEHIVPGSGDNLDGLCLACPSCNLSKAKATSAIDPETGDETPLFNPRKQEWNEHFEWIENGTVVQGLTTVGRATVNRLKMNQLRIVEARKVWVLAGVHPPKQKGEP